MSINFERNAYCRAFLRGDSAFTTAEDKEIFRKVFNMGFRSEIGKVSFWQFASQDRQYHNSQNATNWPSYMYSLLGIPLAVWCAVAQTIYHLALIALDTISTLFCTPCYSSDYCTVLQARCFCIIRDLQESFGWLLSIFDDRWGEFNIQESAFHKSCYDCFLVGEQTCYPEGFYSRQADNYLAQGDRENALRSTNVIGYYNVETHIAYIEKIAFSYLKSGDVDNALEVINGLAHSSLDGKQEQLLFEKVANHLLAENNPTQALKVIDKIYGNPKKSLYEKVVLVYLIKGQPDDAQKMMAKIAFDDKLQDNLYEKIVLAYLNKDQPGHALNVISMISYDSYAQKNNCYQNVILHFLAKNEPNQASSFIDKIERNHKMQEDLLEQVASHYFKNGKLTFALHAINNSTNVGERNRFIGKVANEYLNQGNKVAAVATIEQVTDLEIQRHFLVKVALSYFSDSNEKMVRQIFAKILGRVFKEKMSQRSDWTSQYQEIIKDYRLEVADLFSRLASELYQYISLEISEAAEEAKEVLILWHIKAKAEVNSTLDAFLALKPKPKPKPNYESKDSSYSHFNFHGFEDFFRSSRPPPAPMVIVDWSQHYRTLGLSTMATLQEVRTKYKSLCKTDHPDKIERQKEENDAAFAQRTLDAQENFKKITGAHSALVEHLTPAKTDQED